MWWRWEDDSAWSDSLLSDIQTSFPIMLWEGVSEEQMADTLSVYQVGVNHTDCIPPPHPEHVFSQSQPTAGDGAALCTRLPFCSFGDYWLCSLCCTLCMALKASIGSIMYK